MMVSKTFVALALALALWRPAWGQSQPRSFHDPFERTNGDRYGLARRDSLSHPKLGQYDESLWSDEAEPDGRPARDPFGAAISGNPSTEQLFGPDAALDSLRSFGARDDAASRGASATPGPNPPTLRTTARGGDGLPASPGGAGGGQIKDPTAAGLQAPRIELDNGGFYRAAVESDDLVSPQGDVVSGAAAKPPAGPADSDASGLFGFNPYDANSIVAPSRPAAPGGTGATPASYGAAGLASGLALSGSLSGGLGPGLSSTEPLKSSLPSSRPSSPASPLGPASLGPLR